MKLFNSNKKLFIVAFVSIIFGVLVGYFLFQVTSVSQGTPNPPSVVVGKTPLNSPTYEVGYNEGLAKGQSDAMKAVNDTLMRKQIIKYPLDTSLNVATPIYELWGFIKAVKQDGFVIEYGTSQFFGLDDSRLATADVEITSSSSVYTLSTSIAPDVQDGGQKSNGGGSGAVVVNSEGNQTGRLKIAHEKKKLAVSDLKPGDYVRLTSTEDVKSVSTLQASEVQLYPLKENPYLKGEFNGSYEFLPFSVHLSQKSN
jgi:hypothetical protein